MELLFGGLKNLALCVMQWCQAVYALPLELPFVWIALGAVLGLFWFYSGVLSADAAEVRGYAPRRHLLAGLLIPYLYPLILPLVMKPVEGSELYKRNMAAARAEKKRADAAAAEAAEQARKEADRLADESGSGGWNSRRIEHLQSEADKRTDGGGFLCRLTDGTEVRVKRFLPSTAEAAVMEILPERGGNPVTYRLPYARIDSIEIMNE